MAQDFPNIEATDLISASRENILARDNALKSSFAGSTFPASNLTIGMFCYRTDLQKLYILESTGPSVWREIPFSVSLGTAASANVGTSGDNLGKLNTANTFSAIQTFGAGINFGAQEIVGNSGSIKADTDLRLNAAASKNINLLINGTSRVVLNADGGLVVGSATGGSIGPGSINAVSVYQGGVPLGTAAFVNTGTGSSQVPLNSNLGTLALKSTVAFSDISTAALANQLEAEAGTSNSKLMTPLRVAQAIAALQAIDVQTFQSDGTWTKPSTGTLAYIRLWGAGGGGGRSGSGGSNFGSGGGGGGYAEAWIPLSKLASSVSVSIGQGGQGALISAGNQESGSAGEESTFGSFLTAYAGGGGGWNNGGGGGGSGSNGSTATGSGQGWGGLAADLVTPVAQGTQPYPFIAARDGGFGNGSAISGYNFVSQQDVRNGHGGGGGGSTANRGGHAVHGGGGGGASTGSTGNGTPGNGGTSLAGGNGGRGSGPSQSPTDGVWPGGGGGGSHSASYNAGNGADGGCIVYVF